MSAATPEPKVPPESVRTPVVGSPRRCLVCQAVDLTGRQTVCSAACRGARTRQRETAARQARDREIRVLLETARRKLGDGALGVHVEPVDVRYSGKYADAFAMVARSRPDAVIVPSDPEFYRDRRALVDQAVRTRLPTSYERREFVELGGLMSYGSNLQDIGSRVTVYVDKILKGAKPGDLPIEPPTKFELVFNLKTAKALGLTIPPSLLQRGIR